MATKKTTKKAASAASTPRKKTTATATKTTTTRTVSAKSPVMTPTKRSTRLDATLPSNLVNIVIAEVIGTFILTLVALFASLGMTPLYVGLTLMALVLIIGGISGAHVNPAVTFGLWTMRKLKTVLVPFYWAAQFLGAMAAVVLVGSLSMGNFVIHFDHFLDFSWSIFALELIGMALFMFGVAAAVSRTELKQTSKALAIGSALMIGLVATSTLYPVIQSAAALKQEKDQAATLEQLNEKKQEERLYPRDVYVGGATLNPAVALAVTEKTDSQLRNQGMPFREGEKAYTRLSLEVILATLIGAALGGNLFLLANYRNKTEA